MSPTEYSHILSGHGERLNYIPNLINAKEEPSPAVYSSTLPQRLAGVSERPP